MTTLLLGILTSISTFVGEGESLPRYRFQPAQEFTIRSSSTFKNGEGQNGGEQGSQSN
jgi:hypothetical protein